MKTLNIFILFIFVFLFNAKIIAQTDTTFWFAVPEVTHIHNPGAGEPTYVHLAALGVSANVTISMPRNPAFVTTTFTIPANGTQKLDLTWYVRSGYGAGPFNILNLVPNIGAANESNILESGLTLTTGTVENKGIHISSTALITAYLERNNQNNPDIWALKGTNALGTDFYVPSQNWRANGARNPMAANAIDIVATEDTWVYFVPKAAIQNIGAGGVMHQRYLLKGQSICLRATTTAVANHLGGTHIWSDANIVVQWKDDSVTGDLGCQDLQGDQMIPITLAGDEYIVMRGQLTTSKEYVFIISLSNGTIIDFVDPGGIVVPSITLGAPGTIQRVLLNNFNGIYIDAPVVTAAGINPTGIINSLFMNSRNGESFLVYHVTGFGCEMGTAVLPTIRGCTGSTKVYFTRSTNEGFFLNIMCKESHIDDFIITINNTPYTIPANWFTEIPGTGTSATTDWWYLDKFYNNFGVNHTVATHGKLIPFAIVGAVTTVENTTGLFHLGLINGGTTSGCRYGYFSDYSDNFGEAIIASSGSDYLKYCFDDTIQLQATGGIAYAWENASTPFVGGTFIDPKNVSNTRVTPPPGFHTYEVTITRPCYLGPSADTLIPVQGYGYPQITADFDTTQIGPDCCSPYEMKYINQSTGANKYEWTFERVEDTLHNIILNPEVVYFSNEYYTTKSVKTTLKASYSNNCPDTSIRMIPIKPQITAKGVTGPKSGCQQDVSKTYTIDTVGAGPITSVYWNWGDGDETETLENALVAPFNFTHIFTNLSNNDTTYYVTLVFIDSVHACRDTLTPPYMDTVFVPGVARARYTLSTRNGCSPLAVVLSNSSNGDITYKWWINDTHDFTGAPTRTDNFTSANLNFVNNASTLPKNYYTFLEVTKSNIDGSTCFDTYGPDTITVYPEFVTSINPVPLQEGCNPLTIDYSQTTNPNVPNLQYAWDFGDGSSSAAADPLPKQFSHLLSTDQPYTVNLTTTSEYNCKSVAASRNVNVYAFVNASFTVNDTNICSTESVNFQNNSFFNSVPTQVWRDNGVVFTPTIPSFTRSFTNLTNTIQTHVIALTNSNTHAGCEVTFTKTISVYPEITPNFTPSSLLICHNSSITFNDISIYGDGSQVSKGGGVTYLWDFGDGSTSSDENPTHVFKNTANNGITPQSFNVTLTIKYNNECDKFITIAIQVYPQVIASIATDTSSICTPSVVTFVNGSSHAVSYQWFLDDALLQTTTDATYTIDNLDPDPNKILNPVIKLIATNDFCSTTITKTLNAYPHLVPHFNLNQTIGCNPLPVSITNNSTGGTLICNWDFKDGTFGTQGVSAVPFSHIFSNNSNDSVDYNIQLTVTNGAGCSETFDSVITVLPFVDASFTTSAPSGCSPFEVVVTNTTPAFAGVVSTWNLGTGTGVPNNSTPFTVTFVNQTGAPILPVISLTNTNGTGACDSIFTKTVTVYPEITANFLPNTDTICNGDSITFNNLSTYSGVGTPILPADATYFWEFGDNATESSHSPKHKFINTENNGTTPQRFTVKLTIAANGCTHMYSSFVYVYPEVKAQLNTASNLLCSPTSITLNNTSIGANQFTWDFSDGTSTQVTNNLNPITYLVVNPKLNDTIHSVVYLTATNNNATLSCINKTSLTLQVYPQLKAKIVPDLISGCGPLLVNLANATTGGNTTSSPLTYVWDFGDGLNSTSGSSLVAHTFGNRTNANITYTVSLVATNNLGCTNQHDTTITVFPEVESNFTYLKTTECSPMPVFLDNNSLNGTLFKWNFGFSNQVLDTVGQDFYKTFIHTNANPNDTSKYKIRLIAFDSNHPQCSDTSFKDIIIYPQVRSSFVVSNNDTVCYPEITEFTNNSTGYQLTYVWDYADGNTSATQSLVHTHLFENRATTTKTYTVKLTAIDKNGCPSNDTKKVVAYPRIIAGFTFQKDELDKCTPIPVHFTYPSSAINGNRFTWDFGDGTSPEVKAKVPFDHIFDNPDLINPLSYTIKLTVDDTRTGCVDDTTRVIKIFPKLLPKIDPTVVSGCNPHPVVFTNRTNLAGGVSHLWAFGDNQTSNIKSPNHTFINLETQNRDYEVVLTATQDSTGCILTADTTITVYSYVKAIFGLQADAQTSAKGSSPDPKNVIIGGCTPFDVAVTDSTKLNPTGTILWDFGYTFPDIADSSATMHRLTYLNFDNVAPLDNAPYTIKLLATNFEGCQDSTEQTLMVYPRPIADFSAIFHGCHPLTIDFTNQSEANNGYTYFWELGDGSTLVEKDITHTFYNYSYFDPKTITIKLTASSESECSDSVVKEVTVYPKPLASITTPEDRGCPPFQTLLNNTSKGTGLTFYWDFDNGDTERTQSIQSKTPLYLNDTDIVKTYNVQLITETSTPDKCYDTVFQPIIVYPNVVASFAPDIHEGCSPLEITFSNSSLPVSADGATVFHWEFGDGLTSVLKNPVYRYVNETDNDVTYTITLTASSVHGCDSTITDQVTIYLTPNAEFLALQPIKTYPDTIFTFKNLAKPGPWTFDWDYGDGSPISHATGLFHDYAYTGWGPRENNFIDTVWFTVYSDNCRDSLWQIVTRKAPPPYINILERNPKGCIPLNIQFGTSYEFGIEETITWDFGDNESSTEKDPYHSYDTAGVFVAYVEIAGDGGTYIDTTLIEVYPLPIPGFEIYPDFVMLPDQKVQFFNTSFDGLSYLWDFGDGGSSTERSPSYLYTVENLDGYPVKLVVTTKYGCVDSLTHTTRVTVSGEGNIEFPNAFLPTDSKMDGYYNETSNDVFYPVNYGVKNYELWIFNRWGEQIFYSEDIRVGWNGRYGNNGNTLSQDVYFWKAKGEFNNGVPFKLAGDVTLIRR